MKVIKCEPCNNKRSTYNITITNVPLEDANTCIVNVTFDELKIEKINHIHVENDLAIEFEEIDDQDLAIKIKELISEYYRNLSF